MAWQWLLGRAQPGWRQAVGIVGGAPGQENKALRVLGSRGNQGGWGAVRAGFWGPFGVGGPQGGCGVRGCAGVGCGATSWLCESRRVT